MKRWYTVSWAVVMGTEALTWAKLVVGEDGDNGWSLPRRRWSQVGAKDVGCVS